MEGMTVSWLTERNARKFPEKEAAVMRPLSGGRSALTNAALNERVNRVANGLKARGIERQDKVAVYTANSFPTIETYLGAMRIGAIPVPINHRFQAAEVRYVLDDSDAELLLFDEQATDVVDTIQTDPETPDELLFSGPEVPSYADDYGSFRDDATASPVDIVPARLDTAMLMYTSGTTGKPKGCLLTHDNILQSVINTVAEKAFSGEQVDVDGRGLIVTPLFHIAAFTKFLNNHYASATTVLMDGFEADTVLQVMETESITDGFFVPTMARALLAEDLESYDVSAFTEFGIGGAPAGIELKKAIAEAFDAGIREAFGQTEMSPTTTLLMPEQAFDHADTVGQPMTNVLCKVTDPESGEEVAAGEIGEIRYRGPTMFQGYYEMPERTSEAFEDGYFVSGDLVTRDEDGFVRFVGRSDNMIITGGENVYPDEIEEVLHEHPAIEEAAVVGVPDERWGERIKAVVVPADSEELSGEGLRQYVGERLADYKKPKEFEFLDSLPRNPSGKVLRDPLTDDPSTVDSSS